ncbi:CopD family protein [Gynuella sunshinyii]|nr:CopD family protein [Gynuella sunshinyii]
MMTYGIALLLHILAATIWTGGHIVLATIILPDVLRRKTPQKLLSFEALFERIAMPALLIQVVTGIYLAYHLLPDYSQWHQLNNPVSHGIIAKLTLLLITVLLALDARFRVMPKLSEDNLGDMAWHIIAVTLLAILFVATGVSFRTGWLF